MFMAVILLIMYFVISDSKFITDKKTRTKLLLSKVE